MFLVDMFLWPGGRIGRTAWWLGCLVLTVAVVALAVMLFPGMHQNGYNKDDALTIVAMPFAYPFFVLYAKRWHDRGKSAWWFLLTFVPIIGPLWSIVELGFLRGTDGWNRFGEDPRSY